MDEKSRVATITFNDPKRLNALTADMGDQFLETLDELKSNIDGVGAVVLTGAGTAFSAGGDLAFLKNRHDDSPHRNSMIMRKFYSRFLALRELPVPVVAAINGHAIGAGCAVALACDVRIAAADAKLGVTFVGLGLHPGMGSTYFLPALVGPQIAARMLLTGEVISGTKAEALGMVAEALPTEEVVPTAHKLAAQMASAAPVAVRTCVRSLRMRADAGLDQALWREADAQCQTYASLDLGEGVDAVASKRRPVFQDYAGYEE
jgi:enoyl-CoA hydratase/carnithine racemase